jgi:predicted ATPase
MCHDGGDVVPLAFSEPKFMSNTAIHNPYLFVITGGPGVGKTTLLQELHKRDMACVSEAARQIIQEQVQANGDAVPWSDTTRYTEMMLERSIADYVKHSAAEAPTFFDRGIPDALCYARLIGLRPDEIQQACDQYRYNRVVFLAPPWQEIYTVDNERKQTFAEAIETHRLMSEAYGDCGYEVAELPLVNAVERAEFVLSALRRWPAAI